MKSITSKELLKRRDELSKDITDYWKKIKQENIIPKGYKRNWDLKQLLTKIEELGNERIMVKLYLQCINMGYKKFSEMPDKQNYMNIFTLSEKQEQMFHLNKIKTIDPKLKRSKGKHSLNTTEELTSDFIKKQAGALQLQINSLMKNIEEFNNAASLDIEEVPSFLAA